MGRAYYKTLAGLALMFFVSCNKEDKAGNSPIPPAGDKVFIVCEGSYGNGNASLSIYFPEKDSVFTDVYKAVNHNTLGDVFQSITAIGNRYYLTVNNSDKIVVLNKDLTLFSQISVSKARYIVPVNEHKAYVSSLYNNKVFVLDAVNATIVKSIELSAVNTEGMLVDGNHVYVCPWDTASDKVYVINCEQDEVVDSFIVAGRAPSEALMDKDKKLWILSGNNAKGKRSYWTKIDPFTRQVLKTYAFDPDVDPVKPVMNKTRDSIYFIEVNQKSGSEHNGIYRMSVYEDGLPANPLIPAQSGQYFWALGIHPNGDIYVGDPKGFIQKSSVIIFDRKGVLKKQFSVGVGVGRFYFSD